MNALPGVAPGLSPLAPRFSREFEARGVFFGLPAYGGVMHAATRAGLRDARHVLEAAGLQVGYCHLINESLVTRARNTIVGHFLASDASHLMFVDSDIGFRGAEVLRLLAHGKPLIGGLYRKKTRASRDYVGVPLPGGVLRLDRETMALEMAAIGTGFMLIQRQVIERMVEAFPHLRYHAGGSDGAEGSWRDHLYDLFGTQICPHTRGLLSEDYTFCARWRALGGEVWADPGILLQHWGYLPETGAPSPFEDRPMAQPDVCFAGDPLADFYATGAA